MMNASFFQGSIETGRRFVNTADLTHAAYKSRFQKFESKSKIKPNEALSGTLAKVALILKAGYDYIPVKEDTTIPEDVKKVIKGINNYSPQSMKTVYGYFNSRDGHDFSKI